MKRMSSKIKFVLFLALIVLGWQLGQIFHLDLESVEARLKRFPVFWAGAIFVVLYVGLTSFVWFSKDFLRVVAAFVFGVYGSTGWIWIGEAVNAVILFHVSRNLGREFVEKKFSIPSSRFDQRLEALSFSELFSLRAVVLVPFRFLDLGCGLTKINFLKYFAAVLAGSPLRIFFQQFFVVALGEALLKDFNAVVQYLSNSPWIAAFVLIYFTWTVIVFFRMKQKFFNPV